MNILSSILTLLVLLLPGGVLMLLAVIFAIALYIWGHVTQKTGPRWNDLIALALIYRVAFPIFVIGPIPLPIGLILRI